MKMIGVAIARRSRQSQPRQSFEQDRHGDLEFESRQRRTDAKVNAAAENYSKTHKKMAYIDITKVMYLPNGQVNGSLFLKDSLHMNLEGYKLWTGVLKPILSLEK